MMAQQQQLPFIKIVMDPVRADNRRREVGQTIIVDGMNGRRDKFGRANHECPGLYRGRKVKVAGHVERDGTTLISVEGLPLLLAPGEYHWVEY
jgi:hypothetical protein